MLNKKSAFTLAEVMVTLAVLGILASIMLPAISKIRPNRAKAMFKKAYYVAERMVYELVNDNDLYPSSGMYYGLDNFLPANYLGTEYGGSANSDAAKAKFCSLFARKVNTTSDTIHCDSEHQVPTGGGTYSEAALITTDGIHWYLPNTQFGGTATGTSETPTEATLYVDVNGVKGPNCSYNASTCIKPDIFSIIVSADGKMHVTGDKEKEYLESNDSTQ